MEGFVFLLVIVAAAWVFSDARARGQTKGKATIWLIGVISIFIIFFPLWLIMRPAKLEKLIIIEKPKLCTSCGKYYEGTPNFCPNCGQEV